VIQVPPGRSMLAGHSWPIWVVGLAIIAAVGALLSVWLGRHHSQRAKMLWTAIIVAVPLLGPLAWFTLGWERRRD